MQVSPHCCSKSCKGFWCGSVIWSKPEASIMAFRRKCQGRDFEYMEDGRYYQGIHPFRNADYVFWDSQLIFLAPFLEGWVTRQCKDWHLWLFHWLQVSEEEISFLTQGEDPYDDAVVLKLFHPNLKLLLVTEGPDGCRYYTKVSFAKIIFCFATSEDIFFLSMHGSLSLSPNVYVCNQ